MSYKQKAGSPFQRNFGSKAPLKRHKEGHEQTDSQFYDLQQNVAQDPNSPDYGGKYRDTGYDKMYNQLQADGTYLATKNKTGNYRFDGNFGKGFTNEELKNTHVTAKMRDDQARLDHESRQDEQEEEYNDRQKKEYRKMKKYEKAYYDEQDDTGDYINREAYTRQKYS